MWIQRVGKGLSDTLKIFGLTKAEHIKKSSSKRISKLVVCGISCKALESTILKANNRIPRAQANKLIDHQTMPNLYADRYPKDHDDRLSASSAMKPFVYIKNLLLYIISELQHIMRGTVHEHN